MKPGDFVEISIKSGSIFGQVRRVDGKKIFVQTDDEAEMEVSERRIQRVYCSDAPCSFGDFEQNRVEFAQQIELPELWEILVEEGGSAPLCELADLALASTSPAAQAAMSRAMADDQIYFKNKKDGFEPNTQRVVDEKQRQLAALERSERETQQVQAEIVQALDSETPLDRNSLSRLTQQALDAVQDAAINGQESPTIKRAAATVDGLDIDRFDRGNNNPFLDLMVQLGIWDEDILLGLLRNQLEIDFSPGLLENLPQTLPDGEEREDRCDQFTVAIDDEDTTEIDDAFSLGVVPDGFQLSIFIADPSMLIKPGSALDLEARRRGSTQYFPNQKIPMLPPALSSGLLSLLPGERRPALAFDITIDTHGNYESLTIKEVWIRVDHHLSYDEADRLIVEDRDRLGQLLRDLDNLTREYREQRVQNGALFFPRAEVKIIVDPERQISIKPIDSNSASRQLISELMIMVGHEMAAYCVDNELQAVYRSQTIIEEEAVQQFLQNPLPANIGQALRLMPRARTGLAPDRHDGLGVESYMQLTSPLRRYPDLAQHYQLKAHLKGDNPVFSGNELMLIVKQVELLQDIHTRLERESKRYWTLKYLSGRINEVFDAVVLEKQPAPNRYRIEIPELATMENLHSQTLLDPNQSIRVRVTQARPRMDSLRLKLVQEPAGEAR